MGIPYEMAVLLLQASRAGADLSRPLCLGRLRMSIRPYELAALLDRLAPNADPGVRARALASSWADPFLELLGAEAVHTLDASPYEGADIVHSLNEPLPTDLCERFSVVIDGGTLEHVFNIPVALDNVMKLLRPNGVFMACGPGNNQIGAGFFQFSPELYFRTFSPPNGFRVLGLYLAAAGQTHWWQVRDPAESGRPSFFRASGETRILCVARKDDPDGHLREIPTQSKYTTAWDAAAGSPAAVGPQAEQERTVPPLKRRVFDVLPRGVVSGYRDWRTVRRTRRRSPGDLRRVDPLTMTFEESRNG
ncbi:hypothetical protein SAMN05421720_10820 [Rhodospira trueperi]|uniref:Methyltransferase domain-containing protein n=2 Tax=Rhodospira trueperi TaxID=69960 RepID=A0A1G7DUP2_9PROT|nr:hypothetical protein SAMN05421720_10820 [Rhodospira trueperi]